jgi:hypothetical protein
MCLIGFMVSCLGFATSMGKVSTTSRRNLAEYLFLPILHVGPENIEIYGHSGY